MGLLAELYGSGGVCWSNRGEGRAHSEPRQTGLRATHKAVSIFMRTSVEKLLQASLSMLYAVLAPQLVEGQSGSSHSTQGSGCRCTSTLALPHPPHTHTQCTPTHIRTRTCTHTHTHTCTVHAHTHTHTHMHTCMHTSTPPHTHALVHLYKYTRTQTHAHTHTHVYWVCKTPTWLIVTGDMFTMPLLHSSAAIYLGSNMSFCQKLLSLVPSTSKPKVRDRTRHADVDC